MKIKSILAVLALGSMLTFTACGGSTPAEEAPAEPAAVTEQPQTEQMTKVEYTCPMHPEIVQDSMGKCPTCGMDLEKKEVAQ